MVEKGMEKVTWMKLKTDNLDSDKNFTKVKKALSSIPQIRDQIFDEKSGTVIIKVVCCSPEKIMDKLCTKGHGAIQLIQTIDPPKPLVQRPNEFEKPKEVEKPKDPEKPKPEPAGSSQPVTMMQANNPVPVMGQAMYNGPYYSLAQHNGYYDSYGSGPPPPPLPPYGGRSGYFGEEDLSGCSIM